jgi:hypothetical protein
MPHVIFFDKDVLLIIGSVCFFFHLHEVDRYHKGLYI